MREIAVALLCVLSQTAWTSAQELTPTDLSPQAASAAAPQEQRSPRIDVDSIGAPPNDASVRWGRIAKQTLFVQAIQQSFLMTEQRARHALSGPFFTDWFESAASPFVEPHWSDGGTFLVNYIGHPMAGSTYAYVFRQNDPSAMQMEFGKTGYGAHLAKAMGIAAISSAQWEIGPFSEASLENVGKPPERYKMAWIDFVVTPTLGVAWMAGEDALDRYVIQRFERRIDSATGRAVIRVLMNPTRSLANVVAGQKPWARPGRP